jgi:hypothetical protein
MELHIRAFPHAARFVDLPQQADQFQQILSPKGALSFADGAQQIGR